MKMLSGSDRDVYLAVIYIVDQLDNEARGKSPFVIDTNILLNRIQVVVPERKATLTDSSWWIEKRPWSDLIRTKIYFRNKTGIDLFPDPYFDEDMDDEGFRSLLVGECFNPSMPKSS